MQRNTNGGGAGLKPRLKTGGAIFLGSDSGLAPSTVEGLVSLPADWAGGNHRSPSFEFRISIFGGF